MNKKIVVALAGNPNAGKSSLFNQLTGLHAHVGNYPGVTVEKKWGSVEHNGYEIQFVDLPGTYSLNSYSLEEKIARDFIFKERPDLVVDVVDTTNLERNLYLSLQFLEIGIPTILALNMMDLSLSQGIVINQTTLAETLGTEVVPVVARTGEGIQPLLDSIVKVAEAKKPWKSLEYSYGSDLDEVLNEMLPILEDSKINFIESPARWLAIKYLENDLSVADKLSAEVPEIIEKISPLREKLSRHFRTTLDDAIEGVITDRRYGFLTGLGKKIISRTKKDVRNLSDTIDKVLLNRFLSPIFFLGAIFLLYQFTFWASAPITDYMGMGFDWLSELASEHMADGLLKELVINGLIGGVGGVLGFVPLIAFMFVGIAFLEDSGYMARVAFILDRIFRAFGLHGNSVVALIVAGGIAGGCAIPGVMATRTLRDPKERLATILVTPFMTCGAKIPVFLMLVAAFFSSHQGTVMFGITIFAWAIALISAKILRLCLLKGEPTPFVLELPPYRMPTLRGILLHAWERTWSYIKKAGTVIVAITVVIWVLMTFPSLPEDKNAVYEAQIEQIVAEAESVGDDTEKLSALSEKAQEISGEHAQAALEYSLAGRIGKGLEFLSKPIGFEWRTNISLVGGFAAKEVVLSVLGTSYAMSDGSGTAVDEILAAAEEKQALSQTTDNTAVAKAAAEEEDEEAVLINTLAHKLQNNPSWTPLVAISLMIFVLIYAPCFVTIVVIKKEVGTKWAAFSLLASTAYAYILCLLVYQGGLLLGFKGAIF